MEIEHTLTQAAEKQFTAELARLGKELREEVVDQAFKTRGKPVEVTASDVRRVAQDFRFKENEHLKESPFASLVMKVYTVAGFAAMLIGLILQLSRRLFVELIFIPENLSTMLVVTGAFLVVISTFLRHFITISALRCEHEKGQQPPAFYVASHRK
jgi:hypothetical protein